LAAATGRKHPPFKYFYYSDLATFRIVISAGLDGSNPAEIRHSYVQLAGMTELNTHQNYGHFRVTRVILVTRILIILKLKKP
jgi:hypothetical protein